jgi:uncharacterized protein
MKIPDSLARTCLSPRSLGLILLPTEQCNFRCTYCYEDFALPRMRSGVVAGVKALLSARAPTLDELHLSWFGGEPLLALDIVEDVQRHAQELARMHAGMRLGANMTTNAWRLSPAVFARLLSLGVDDYQISFDGPPEHHDKKRVRADGRSTFERIWRNVLAMRERAEPFKIRLRLHVDRENLEAMFPFVDRCLETFGHDPRFVLYLKPLSLYGGPNDVNLSILSSPEDWSRFAELERRAARASATAVPAPLLPGPTGTAPARPAPGHGEICYAARGNHFVVRSDGRLCKCTIVLDHPKNQVGRLREDGTVEISAAAMQPWMRGLWSGREGELLCPMLGLVESSANAASPQLAR